MNVLIIGKDSEIFKDGSNHSNDVLSRHCQYSEVLKKQFGDLSNIRILNYSCKKSQFKKRQVTAGMIIYPTQSIRRFTFLLDAARILPSLFHGWKPDLITAQEPWEEGILAWVTARITRAKFLQQLHLDIFSVAWKCEKPINRLKRLLGGFILKRADAVRVVSEGLKYKTLESLKLPLNKVYSVPVSVELFPSNQLLNKEKYKENIFPGLSKFPLVLYVGRFYAPKNLQLWVDVAIHILQNRPDVRFLLVGDGPDFSEIQARIKASKYSHNFILPGKKNHEKLPEIFSAADVFLMTSSHEGFGRVILEAQFSGIPVVSTRCVGPEELIVHGENGFICTQGDIRELSEAVLKLLNNSILSSSMGEKSREQAKNKYTREQLVLQLVNLWGSVVNCGRISLK